ncbi:hypothetical protein GOODEAATRI_011346 [Goodea atripinnis]|uniref:PH domain-containing protein n=1 Tax=Goodea atripinnis TaxID=208336 RepID=A0ABV0PN55_9TELE
MCGNPDVLEYYQSKNSKKPIRTIDLKECEVEMLNNQLRIKRDFHGKHLFVVKTSSRIFYLVANTEEEMNSWISSISQICRFGNLEEAGSGLDVNIMRSGQFVLFLFQLLVKTQRLGQTKQPRTHMLSSPHPPFLT